MTRPRFAVALLTTALAIPACLPVDATVEVEDSSFVLSCTDGCGQHGRDGAIAIEVTVLKNITRQITICCDDELEVLARLLTIRDFWCEKLDVPVTTVGHVTIGTTVSAASRKRGATLNQGDGYVAFNCDDWLPKLIEQMQARPCCVARSSHARDRRPR